MAKPSYFQVKLLQAQLDSNSTSIELLNELSHLVIALQHTHSAGTSPDTVAFLLNYLLEEVRGLTDMFDAENDRLTQEMAKKGFNHE
ncbi:MAG: hypothetical protein WAQ53_15410 [Thiofilum sp.]|uniref:hypothetical protein n=1 Tax=Thiofilum sp. TaxID=2212733 RepID=UPI0025E19156|nr:hypothetical protein [Thiofilum sp.]MBK8451764.1 hypothetical protein [Thiofilum sp.]